MGKRAVGVGTQKGPYVLLAVEPECTPSQLRKAYHKLALKVHPDKNPSEEAVESFQALQKAYALLSDPELRRRYDRTGCTDEESQSFNDAYSHYRSVYTEISKEDIEQFSARYRESDMEQDDLRQFYAQHKGDLTHLMSFIPLAVWEDVGRFIAFLETAVADGSLEAFPKFAETKSKIKECVDDDSDGEDLDGEDEEENDEDFADDDKDLNDFIADEDDAEAEEAAAMIAAEEEQQQQEEEEVPAPPPKKAKKAALSPATAKAKAKPAKQPKAAPKKQRKKSDGGRSRASGGGGLDGVDPTLLAMFASRNAERSSGLDAFEERWAKKASAPGKKKKKKKKQTR